MSDTKPQPRRGRPATGTALSATERSRRLHEKAESVYLNAFHPGRPLADVADSVLLLALTGEYRTVRAGRNGESILIRYVRELLLRAGVESTALSSLDAHYSIDPAVNPVETTDIDTVETTDYQADSLAVETTITETPLAVESTDSQSAVNPVDTTINTVPTIHVETTDNRPVIIPVGSTDKPLPPVSVYPMGDQGEGNNRAALIARIRQMSDQGRTSSQIAAAFNAEGIPTLSARGIWQPGTIRVLLKA